MLHRVEVDVARLAQIREVMGVELSELVGGMLDTMRTAIEETERAMATGALDRAAKAAHACRNDALMLGAKQLLAALSELEQAARAHDRPRAEAALVGVQAVWPATRDELTRIASDS
jgi:HPt (histidine-containing phosphotransfer) domain-containing protein